MAEIRSRTLSQTLEAASYLSTPTEVRRDTRIGALPFEESVTLLADEGNIIGVATLIWEAKESPLGRSKAFEPFAAESFSRALRIVALEGATTAVKILNRRDASAEERRDAGQMLMIAGRRTLAAIQIEQEEGISNSSQ